MCSCLISMIQSYYRDDQRIIPCISSSSIFYGFCDPFGAFPGLVNLF